MAIEHRREINGREINGREISHREIGHREFRQIQTESTACSALPINGPVGATDAQRGMALILVVLVLSSLVAIGTPFVISMKLQERGSVHTVARERAHLAALSARNHTLAHLFGNHPSRERENVDDDGIPAHKYDTWEELQISFAGHLSLDDQRLQDFIEKRYLEKEEGDQKEWRYTMRGDQGGRTIDAYVEDEQGKINLNTAMPNLIGNLLAGSHLSEAIKFDQQLTELPLDDTTSFPADDDPDTVDGVVAILNPIFFTVEAISYRGKTETHLTGCFRGEYISGTWEHQKGWPVFDLRGLKVFLHRYYDLGEGQIDTFRTPQAIREIADWSVIPYFLETMAIFGLDLKNMQEFGLTPEMLLRAGLQDFIGKFEKEETPVDEKEYRDTRSELIKLGIPAEAIDLLEQFRGKVAVIEIGKVAKQFNVDKVRANAFKGVFETTIKKEFKRVKDHSRDYFPKAIAAYQDIFDQPGLETFTAADFERIRGYITTHSSLDALWSAEQTVLGEISTDPFLGVPSFRIARYDHFNPGTLVRIRSVTDPNKLEFHLAAGAFPDPRGGRGRGGMGRGTVIQGGVILKDRLKYEYEEREAVVSAQLRHPVDINTAPRRVIEAVLTGISTDRFSQQFDSVTTGEARKVAAFLLDNLPITGFGKFRELIDEAAKEGLVDDEDIDAILLNATNPNHPRLTISTTGFCYTSSDVYTIEASGVVRNPAGVEVASDRFREVIEVAPPDPLTYVIDSQDDWTGFLFRRDAPRNDRWVSSTTLIPGRAQHLMTTSPIPINQKRFEAPSLVEGALHALTNETPAVNGISVSVEHFPESIEGLDVGSHAVDVSQLPPEDPLSIDLWVQPRTVAGEQVLFDTLVDPDQPFENRIRLTWKGDTRELVFQIYDDARITNYGRRTVVPCAEIVHSLGTDWQPDTWYHVTAAWGSAIPGDQVLMIDQRPVGRHTFLTELTTALTDQQEGFLSVRDVEFASRLPETDGSLWVGGEVIDYTKREGTKFRIGARDTTGVEVSGRARRGTAARAHAAGSTVRPFGYSVELAASDPEISPQSPNQVISGTGGAGLLQDLGPPKETFGVLGFVVVGANQPVESSYPTIRYNQSGQEGAFLLPLTPGQTQLEVFSAVQPTLLGFPEEGYLCVKYWFRPNGATDWTGNIEFIRYRGFISGSQPQTYAFTGLIRAMLGTTMTDSNQFTGVGARRIEIYGVSVDTNVTDLSKRYPPSGIAQITPVQGDVEWFFYKWIAEDRFFIGDPRVFASVVPSPGAYSRQFRGYVGTLRSVQNFEGFLPEFWPANTPIVPVLRSVRGGAEAWDRVLIGDNLNQTQPTREPAAIRVRKVIDGDDGVFIGLDRPTTQVYLSQQLPRVKKFPTGELPTRSSGFISVGASAEGSGIGGQFDGVLDEIRLSRVRPSGGWGVMLTKANGSPTWQTGTLNGVAVRDLIREYPKGSGVDPGDPLDRVRMVPVPRLEGDGATIGFRWPSPNQFANGRDEMLLSFGNEALYGERVQAQTGGGAVFLMQRLRRTSDPDPTTGEIPPPRREVLPQILVNDTDNLPDRHGFLAITSNAGVEILYYERVTGTVLVNVQRGMFGTIVGDYSPIIFDDGTSSIPMTVIETYDFDLLARSLMDTEAQQGSLETILPITMFGASRLDGGIEYAFPLANGNSFPTSDGYLRFDDGKRGTVDEIIGYVRRNGNEFLLGRDDRTGRPLFRGRFGTPRLEHAQDTIVTELLTRYHDRYEPEAESGDMMKWERSISIPGAHYDRLTWTVQADRSGQGRANVLVYSRLDGGPSWDQKPGESRDEIRLFQDPDGDNEINRTADQIELRILYRFRQGSYGPAQGGSTWSDEWKRTPVIEDMTLEYRKDWRVVHREDLPF